MHHSKKPRTSPPSIHLPTFLPPNTNGRRQRRMIADAPTKQLAVSVDASVPSGAYPISITGYNGDKQEEMTFTLIVEGATVAPSTKSIFLPLISK